jgi:DNA-binding beta-propeller fold protein YncE
MDPESGQIRVLWSRGAELDAIVSPDAARLYVTYFADKGYELAVVDTATGGVLHKCETPQLIRWIFPTTPGMAISPDGRWLYLLKANYSAGSSEYSLLTFDTRDSRFVSGEQAVSQCPAPHPVPLSTGGNVVVLCRGGESRANDDGNLLVRVQHSVNFAVGRGVSAQTIYVAGWKGPIQAVDVATRQIIQTSKDLPVRNRRIMPSSNTISPDGRLWYLPLKIPDNGENEIEQILVFDTQTMSMANIITPVGPFLGLALSSDGRHLYASQQDLKSIMVIDTETRRVNRMLEVPGKASIMIAVKAP